MPKRLYRSVENLLDRIDHSAGDEQMLLDVLNLLVTSEETQDFGVVSGRLYREANGGYRLIESIGGHGAAIAGRTISRDYQVVRDLEAQRRLIISPDSPGFDAELEASIAGVDSVAILVGADPAYILSLGIEHHGDENSLLVVMETIRAAVGLKLRAQNLADQMVQAQAIQQSLLPQMMPTLEGFEIGAVTVPAEDVGGDVYDVQEVEDGVLGLLIADASGHGLPAALQARDVVTGMRMGQAEGEKITGTVSRLNRVINRSGLASRFISLFYGELELTGNLVYVNGGHCPPLLLTANGEVYELKTCGPVLGPLPDATYRRGYATLRPGEVLVMFTDGVTERLAPGATEEDIVEFGRDNLVSVIRGAHDRPAGEIARAIMQKVREFGGEGPLEDDVTVMVVKRLPGGDQSTVEDLTPVSVETKR